MTSTSRQPLDGPAPTLKPRTLQSSALRLLSMLVRFLLAPLLRKRFDALLAQLDTLLQQFQAGTLKPETPRAPRRATPRPTREAAPRTRTPSVRRAPSAQAPARQAPVARPAPPSRPAHILRPRRPMQAMKPRESRRRTA